MSLLDMEEVRWVQIYHDLPNPFFRSYIQFSHIFQQPPLIASKKEVHPKYNSQTLTHDICILEFEKPLPLDQNANPGTNI